MSEPRFREPFNVDCPKCQAPRGHRCRTMKTRRTTDTHTARLLRSLRTL